MANVPLSWIPPVAIYKVITQASSCLRRIQIVQQYNNGATMKTNLLLWNILIYEVKDLFPCKMPTKMIISCLLNVKKNLKLGTNELKLDLTFLPKVYFRSNNIHREIDQWNRPSRQLTLSYANEYVCHGVMLSKDTQSTRILNFHPYFRETVILS